MSTRCCRSRLPPKTIPFANDKFQLKLHGPSRDPRRSLPNVPVAGTVNALVLKKFKDEPPQIPKFGFPDAPSQVSSSRQRSARSEKFEPVPELFAAFPPSRTVNGFPVCHVMTLFRRQLPSACFSHPCVA